jgi:hypothetical protein
VNMLFVFVCEKNCAILKFWCCFCSLFRPTEIGGVIKRFWFFLVLILGWQVTSSKNLDYHFDDGITPVDIEDED